MCVTQTKKSNRVNPHLYSIIIGLSLNEETNYGYR